jgi:hypothetical protein
VSIDQSKRAKLPIDVVQPGRGMSAWVTPMLADRGRDAAVDAKRRTIGG